MLHFRAPPVGLGLPPSKLCLLPRRSNGEISLLPRRVGEDGLLPTKEGRRSIIEPRGERRRQAFQRATFVGYGSREVLATHTKGGMTLGAKERGLRGSTAVFGVTTKVRGSRDKLRQNLA